MSQCDPNKPSEPTQEELRQVLRWAAEAAFRQGTSAIEADEVAQKTAIKLWELWNQDGVRSARQASPARWEAFVKKSAQNNYIDLVRSHQRRLGREQRADENARPVTKRPGTVLELQAAGFLEAVARVELVESLKVLEPRYRRIMYLHIALLYTPREIGELFGLDPQTIRVHIRRSKAILRKSLEGDDETTEP